ncbi:hypothetical protein [Anaeromyxobacter paludicola]|uniref:Lipoprotein n=1 Tax=Anaeromyxobacter paludicola TaxID=2918171 RepID=A0ABM7X9F7_9BACT|nr:hypothetical protein [Anaeromyxobacter paludicola]BDG08486.1 hypothetical protein AMPC_15990 [Anaeromyxobacter paludicola]
MDQPSMKLVLLVAFAALAGCGARQHITPTQGRAYGEALASQRARTPAAGQAQAVRGLDAQEADIIAQGYRQSLAPKDSKVKDEPVLLIAPQQNVARQASLPPPSVPKQ